MFLAADTPSRTAVGPRMPSAVMGAIGCALVVGWFGGCASPSAVAEESTTDDDASSTSSTDGDAEGSSASNGGTSNGGTSNDETSGDDGALEIRPGLGIGPVELGMTYAQVRALMGDAEAPFPSNRIVVVAYASNGLELVFASPLASALTDDSVLLAVGAKSSGAFTGAVVPGTAKSQVEAALGVAPEVVGSYAYYPTGLSVRYVEDSAFSVGVVPAYALDPVPPPMVPAELPSTVPAVRGTLGAMR